MTFIARANIDEYKQYFVVPDYVDPTAMDYIPETKLKRLELNAGDQVPELSIEDETNERLKREREKQVRIRYEELVKDEKHVVQMKIREKARLYLLSALKENLHGVFIDCDTPYDLWEAIKVKGEGPKHAFMYLQVSCVPHVSSMMKARISHYSLWSSKHLWTISLAP